MELTVAAPAMAVTDVVWCAGPCQMRISASDPPRRQAGPCCLAGTEALHPALGLLLRIPLLGVDCIGTACRPARPAGARKWRAGC